MRTKSMVKLFSSALLGLRGINFVDQENDWIARSLGGVFWAGLFLLMSHAERAYSQTIDHRIGVNFTESEGRIDPCGNPSGWSCLNVNRDFLAYRLCADRAQNWPGWRLVDARGNELNLRTRSISCQRGLGLIVRRPYNVCDVSGQAVCLLAEIPPAPTSPPGLDPNRPLGPECPYVDSQGFRLC